ncbi:hypothetical protein P4T70_10925 [Bacillus mobilis]|uniref:BC_2427 family protein n=1 Tax=Bacillus mobilis TaxID=2026190 RepID=UPI002E20CD41|nr:hypothetical protein [Bacillus mobilis]
MKKPWVGKGIWNKIHKDKKLNIQDNSRERSAMKKEVTPEIEKKEVTPEIEKKEVVPEIEKEEVVPEIEKEEVVPEIEKEEVTPEIEKKEVVPEIEKEEVVPEIEKKEVVPKIEKKEVVPELEKGGIASESQIEPSVRSMVVKTPFSIISKVSSFRVFPKINVKNQDAFVFRNEKDAKGRELDSKLLTTVQQHHSEAYCKLVSSNLHEKRVLVELYNQKANGNIEENQVETSTWIPIHSIILESGNEEKENNYITARLPIEIGRYKGEISLREKVVFTEKVIGIKKVDQEIILTKTKFLVPKVKKNGQNATTVEKGNLFVEGYIYQCIEYIAEQSTFHNNIYQLMQNIVLELIIQVIQEQEVQVRIT